ncbi:5-formyltetrahydrofolate cyclo-ligase [Brevibacterium yomogidense]|uniref:5-formyltetrahydrofolate cyclo-ligase n=1 Tax=Brevibacterium yomogidense TaxID=946573 RepID=UPI0018DEF410|nr:5-formyltetrahydrofolate cyclo-ligase [Brevibacterium yomogidense]
MNTGEAVPKAQLRADVRARRASHLEAPDTARRTAQDALTAQVSALVDARQPAVVVGYASLPGEPSLDTALERLIDARVPVLLPTTRKGEPLLLGQVTGPLDELPRGTWDIREPHYPLTTPEALADSPAHGTFLVLVPGLAYDAHGVRLGNGGGFYDRTFGPQGLLADTRHAALRARLEFVGVCWDAERTGTLPRADWDLAVGSVLTETGLHTVSSTT